jgi:uncharacterized damage-inducible protein DinB
MQIDEIRLMYDYNNWANRRILDAAGRVTPEQYAAPASKMFGRGGLRGTLVHMLDNEWQWRITCQGYYNQPLKDEEYEATILTEDQFPTLAALEERWKAERREMQAYLDTLTNAMLNGPIRYVIERGVVREWVLWQILYSSVDHATQHRSEVAALLTGYGQSPGDIDFTLYLLDRDALS